jgi:hypothetical protein
MRKNGKTKFVIIGFLLFGLLIPLQNASCATFNVTATDAPCFTYSVQFKNLTTGGQISISSLPVKVVDVNSTVVTVTERWNLTAGQKNDSIYSHYFISQEDITSLSATFGTSKKTYGGVEYTIVNATSGVPMLVSPKMLWYIYDTATGVALEGYSEDSTTDTITHSWLEFYSAKCDLGSADNGDGDGDPIGGIPGYPLGIIMGVSGLVIFFMISKKKLYE